MSLLSRFSPALTILAVSLLLGQTTAAPTATTTKRDVSGGLSNATIDGIKAALAQSASASWEYGTRAEALLEYDYPGYAVFSPTAFPPPLSPVPTTVNSIATFVLQTRPRGILPLMQDGSAGDPASVGVAVLLANWTGASTAGTNYTYSGAAADQLQYLLTKAPRTQDGAISHRADQVQLWSDSVYMVPPFIAYYGAMTNNMSLIVQAYDQCSLYRKYLRDSNGLWKHIVLGSDGLSDPGHWATGNAWAAAGMMRVLATAMHSPFASQLSSQMNDLTNWIKEILLGAWTMQQSNMLLRNYLDEASSFTDSASTSLLASVSYRLAQFDLGGETLGNAENARQAVYKNINSTGWLTQVVNPLSFQQQGVSSPEGQGFVLIMESAYRDWKASGNTSMVPAPATPSSQPSQSSSSGNLRVGMVSFERVAIVASLVGALSWSVSNL